MAAMNPIEALTEGSVNWFADWPTGDVPKRGAIVYTIWNREGYFIYVGMSGRNTTGGKSAKGPYGRLASHASGRRSGDQFCLYVCDRLVLPTVHNRIPEIAAGDLSLDEVVRDFIRTNLGFRWVPMPDARSAIELERRMQRGEFDAGRPSLNPI